MARWQPGAGDRLAEAALELYAERGYEGTTVADIAERAGVTERTFFRHFADKREVLFAGGSFLADLIADEAAVAPPGSAPMAVASTALQAAGAVLQERGEWSKRRYRVIVANPVLQERELAKMAGLSSVLAAALRERGEPAPVATLTAEVGIAAFKVAYERWVQRPTRRDLPELIREAIGELGGIVAG